MNYINIDTDALYAALKKLDLKRLKYLLEDGVDVNLIGGDTLNDLLLRRGDLKAKKEILDYLLEKGWDINAEYDDSPPLVREIREYDGELIKELIELGADVNAGEPLHEALEYYTKRYTVSDCCNRPGEAEYRAKIDLLVEKGARISTERLMDIYGRAYRTRY